MKVTYIESPEGLTVCSREWEELKCLILKQKSDVLITNEMPFGVWLSAEDVYDDEKAKNSVEDHKYGIEALGKLNVPLILSSCPKHCSEKLVNEAFVLENGVYKPVHQKHYFPNEEGFYEPTWFATDVTGFKIAKTGMLNIGFLLCTEVMFNEKAREYGRQGAHLIAVPRATGQNYKQWKTAASMAAIVSGCYVVSSNRVGQYDDSLTFGGVGFAFAPDGIEISFTSPEHPVVSFELDLGWVERQKGIYPCYVKEFDFDFNKNIHE